MENYIENEPELDSAVGSEIMEELDKISKPFRELMAHYRCAILEIETKFRVLNEELSLEHDRNPIESIKTRLKSPPSITRKLAKKNIDLNIKNIEESIFDIAGVRVICSSPSDIYRLAACLIEQDDVTLIRKKDYIRHPKENGYRSMHLIVEVPIFLAEKKKPMKVEIQLRTIAMDFWASLEHKMKYKKQVEDAAALTRELKECADISAALDLRMEELRTKIERMNEE